MSTHLFGLVDVAFNYSHSVGRNEFNGTGFRNPVDMAMDEEGKSTYLTGPMKTVRTVCT